MCKHGSTRCGPPALGAGRAVQACGAQPEESTVRKAMAQCSWGRWCRSVRGPGACAAAAGAGMRSQQGRQGLLRWGPRASVNATHEGTVMQPCSSGSTRGRPSSTTATTLLLVPKSMPAQHLSGMTNKTASAYTGTAAEPCMAHQCKLRRQCAAAAHATPWTRGASAAPRSSGRPCRLRRARNAAPVAFPACLTRSWQGALPVSELCRPAAWTAGSKQCSSCSSVGGYGNGVWPPCRPGLCSCKLQCKLGLICKEFSQRSRCCAPAPKGRAGLSGAAA